MWCGVVLAPPEGNHPKKRGPCCRPKLGWRLLDRIGIPPQLQLPGCALPRRGHLELANDWVWPDFGSVEAVVAVGAHNRAERVEPSGMRSVVALSGTSAARPLIQLAGDPACDDRWPGPRVVVDFAVGDGVGLAV